MSSISSHQKQIQRTLEKMAHPQAPWSFQNRVQQFESRLDEFCQTGVQTTTDAQGRSLSRLSNGDSLLRTAEGFELKAHVVRPLFLGRDEFDVTYRYDDKSATVAAVETREQGNGVPILDKIETRRQSYTLDLNQEQILDYSQTRESHRDFLFFRI